MGKSPTGRILFIDDDKTGREVALFNLRRVGYRITPAEDGQEGLSFFSPEKFDLVITAFGNVETAVEAMKNSAYDFIGELAEGRDLIVPPRVIEELKRRPWPGNVRELKNACERMVILCHGNEVALEDLPVPSDSSRQGKAPFYRLEKYGIRRGDSLLPQSGGAEYSPGD